MIEDAETARTRQGLYRYFGGALSPPGESRLSSLTAAGSYLDTLGLEHFPFYVPWKEFADSAAVARADRLATEYVSLFASGVDGALCPPTESYYRGHAEGGQIAKVVAQIEQEYGDLGLTVARRSEAPDHAATELEVMSMLCAREADAREAGSLQDVRAALFAEDRFLRGHLAVWFPELRARLEEIPKVSGFYRSLIEAIHWFIVHEIDLLTLLRRQVEGATA